MALSAVMQSWRGDLVHYRICARAAVPLTGVRLACVHTTLNAEPQENTVCSVLFFLSLAKMYSIGLSFWLPGLQWWHLTVSFLYSGTEILVPGISSWQNFTVELPGLELLLVRKVSWPTEIKGWWWTRFLYLWHSTEGLLKPGCLWSLPSMMLKLSFSFFSFLRSVLKSHLNEYRLQETFQRKLHLYKSQECLWAVKFALLKKYREDLLRHCNFQTLILKLCWQKVRQSSKERHLCFKEESIILSCRTRLGRQMPAYCAKSHLHRTPSVALKSNWNFGSYNKDCQYVPKHIN